VPLCPNNFTLSIVTVPHVQAPLLASTHISLRRGTKRDHHGERYRRRNASTVPAQWIPSQCSTKNCPPLIHAPGLVSNKGKNDWGMEVTNPEKYPEMEYLIMIYMLGRLLGGLLKALLIALLSASLNNSRIKSTADCVTASWTTTAASTTSSTTLGVGV